RAAAAAAGGVLAARGLGVFYNPGRPLRKCLPRAPSPGHAAALPPFLRARGGDTAGTARRPGGRAAQEPRDAVQAVNTAGGAVGAAGRRGWRET
ncbi:hypothetical protein MC885_009539, partial [Smutsia gigantea]